MVNGTAVNGFSGGSLDGVPHVATDVRHVAFIGDYVPRQCGIATFTNHLREAISQRYPDCECPVLPVDDLEEGYDYPSEVRFQIVEQELDSYRRAASYINLHDFDVVSVQHEFGIYGGPAGRHLLALLQGIRAPIVTTLHTILREPDAEQRAVIEELASLSMRLVVMSERGKTILEDVYDIPAAKIDVIPHGIPDVPFVDPNFYKDDLGVAGQNVLLTFGLLSPNKGIEFGIRALPKILEEFPNTTYVVLGATHPALVRSQGEKYRAQLVRLAQELGVAENVMFVNKFVDLSQLIEYICAADIYVTPYLHEAQITSGTLAYSFGCGKAVVSTPYWHAQELLADDRGVLVPFADADAIADSVCTLLRDEQSRHAMRKRAYMLGREMIWSSAAQLYMESFQRARAGVADRRLETTPDRRLGALTADLPRFRFDHLLRISDSTGIFQHARFAIPNFAHGYCTDDNARALILAVMLEELGEDNVDIRRAASAYAAFLQHAYTDGKWRNFMSFERHWLETHGSEDSLGRLLWALGVCVGQSRRRELQAWAMNGLEAALDAVLHTSSPRTWAYALLGIHAYMGRLSGDRFAEQVRETLTGRLIDMYRQNATKDWPWFENSVTYANATLCEALIASHHWASNGDAGEIGLAALRWLVKVQKSPQGHFRPIGCNGFFHRGEKPARFAQQPIEAHATVSACIQAYELTSNPFWLDEANTAFAWFLGENDLGLPLYNPRTGGCFDGLEEDRVNQNQGAESTLSFLTALAKMKLLERSTATSQHLHEPARLEI